MDACIHMSLGYGGMHVILWFSWLVVIDGGHVDDACLRAAMHILIYILIYIYIYIQLLCCSNYWFRLLDVLSPYCVFDMELAMTSKLLHVMITRNIGVTLHIYIYN